MDQTFFHISPAWINPILLLWIVGGFIVLGISVAKSKSESGGKLPADFWNSVAVFVVGGLLIKFALPMVMSSDPVTGEVRGIPIRGYGFFLLLAVITGVSLAIHRSRRLGLHPDLMLGLCFWVFAIGIAGARLFYVVQKWDEFYDPLLPWPQMLLNMLNMSQGGLVVYGSVFGGLIAAVVFLRTKRLPVGLVLDVIAPCMMIGLSIGRIGCLMNGCCWGGVCPVDLPTITFPVDSPPYARHVETGELFGMKARAFKDSETGTEPREIVEVIPNSLAAQKGVQPGERILAYGLFTEEGKVYVADPEDNRSPHRVVYQLQSESGKRDVVFELNEIPIRSRPVHPTQIYSSINAFFGFLFLWFYFPYRKRDGEVFGLMMIIYPIGRFLLEFIRSDEMGQFGTGITISQWVSFGSIGLGFAFIIVGQLYLKRTDDFSQALESRPAAEKTRQKNVDTKDSA